MTVNFPTFSFDYGFSVVFVPTHPGDCNGRLLLDSFTRCNFCRSLVVQWALVQKIQTDVDTTTVHHRMTTTVNRDHVG